MRLRGLKIPHPEKAGGSAKGSQLGGKAMDSHAVLASRKSQMK